MKLSPVSDWKAGDISAKEYHRLKEQFGAAAGQARYTHRGILANASTRCRERRERGQLVPVAVRQIPQSANADARSHCRTDRHDLRPRGGKITIKFRIFRRLCGSAGLYLASMERPHSPKTPSSPLLPTLSALLEDLGAQPRDFDCIVTGDLNPHRCTRTTLLRGDSIDLSPCLPDCAA